MKANLCQRVLMLLFFIASSLFAQQAKPQLQFHQGTFKIVQFTDIHWDNKSSKNERLLTLMKNIVIAEQPDLVMLTGDIITSNPIEHGWQTVAQVFIDQKIPWAAVLGNHDDESDLTRTEIMTIVENLPYSLAQRGPTELGSGGNYTLLIKDSQAQQNAAVLYCMDSNAYSTIEALKGYGWFRLQQINWFRQQAAQNFVDGENAPLPGLAFFHIPVPEYAELWETADSTCIGEKNETVCAPPINTGMFAAMLESQAVKGVFVGHDHDNDYAGTLHNILLAYGRVTGFDTYGELTRGARVIELEEGKKSFKSWIRTEDGEILNQLHYPESFAK